MLTQRLQAQLDELEARGHLRQLRLAQGVDFTANDYLGLAHHPALAQAVRQALDEGVWVGSGGSRLLRGHHPAHAQLEEEAARFFNAPAALYFNSGFDANLALFSALTTRHDAIIHDERIHASVKEGVRASFAASFAARHNDPQAFEERIVLARKRGAREVLVAVESVYSMDGDRAPLGDLLEITRRLDAVLVVDEAHATGVWGGHPATGVWSGDAATGVRGGDPPRNVGGGGSPPGKAGAGGRGLLEDVPHDPERVIALHTCGKALGTAGALVTGPRVLIDALINLARPFIYSTANTPLMAVATQRALELVDAEPWRRQQVRAHANALRARLAQGLAGGLAGGVNPGQDAPFHLAGDTQIIPVILGGEAPTLAAAQALQARGFDVRAIRPPTVAPGTCRLRVSLSADHTPEQVNQLADAILELARE